MPPPDGIELARLLSQAAPAVRTIVLTMHQDAALVAAANAAGAAGYVVKQSGPDELLQAIRCVAGGGRYLDACLRDEGLTFDPL
jgi:DNA-binding NarL/FixJ family response regulator